MAHNRIVNTPPFQKYGKCPADRIDGFIIHLLRLVDAPAHIVLAKHGFIKTHGKFVPQKDSLASCALYIVYAKPYAVEHRYRSNTTGYHYNPTDVQLVPYTLTVRLHALIFIRSQVPCHNFYLNLCTACLDCYCVPARQMEDLLATVPSDLFTLLVPRATAALTSTNKHPFFLLTLSWQAQHNSGLIVYCPIPYTSLQG